MFKKEPKMKDYTVAPKKKIDWKNVGRETLEWVICIVIAYVIYLVINFFFGTISGVKQVSMFPTAKEGDKLLIQRTILFKHTLERGEIITFEAPIDKGYYEELDPTDVVAEYHNYNFFQNFLYKFVGIGKVSYIKRVIGVAGDHIVIDDDGNVFVNDEKIDEPYLHENNTPKLGVYTDVVVPDGYVYVMGDNRKESKDSRFFGCVKVKHVDGYVITRICPLKSFGKLDK